MTTTEPSPPPTEPAPGLTTEPCAPPEQAASFGDYLERLRGLDDRSARRFEGL